MRHHYGQIEIKANGVDHAVVGKASLEATMYSVDLTDASWLIGPTPKLPVGKLESRIIIDSTHLGRFMGIPDLLVEAPPKETNNATGGTTESGISGNHGLVFTGTPKAADFDKRVSVVGGPVDRRPETRPRWCSPRPACSPGRAPPTSRCPRTRRHAVLAAFTHQPARPEAAVRRRADQRGRPRLRRHHRGHHRGSNHHARRVQTVMSPSLRRDRSPC